jgi:hypothetical protein
VDSENIAWVVLLLLLEDTAFPAILELAIVELLLPERVLALGGLLESMNHILITFLHCGGGVLKSLLGSCVRALYRLDILETLEIHHIFELSEVFDVMDQVGHIRVDLGVWAGVSQEIGVKCFHLFIGASLTLNQLLTYKFTSLLNISFMYGGVLWLVIRRKCLFMLREITVLVIHEVYRSSQVT